MSKSRSKTREMKQVSFRMLPEVYEDYCTVADSRGVDLSALLNWVVVDYRPMLLLRHAENGAAMLRAAALGLPQHADNGPDPQESLSRLNELIRQLQDVASKLATQANRSGSKSAA
jgi:hypothetical protein